MSRIILLILACFICQLNADTEDRTQFARNLEYILTESFPRDSVKVAWTRDGKSISVSLAGPTFRQYEYFDIAWWFMNDVCPKAAKREKFSDIDNKLRVRTLHLSATSATPQYDHGYELISWYFKHWEGKKNFSQ